MNPDNIAKTPEPPYYAVIFTSLRTEGDRGYGHMADRMVELASQQPGFLGVESARTTDGLGITVSYWASEEAIVAWKAHAEHKVAQETGQRVWYSGYHLRVAKVERDYGTNAAPNGNGSHCAERQRSRDACLVERFAGEPCDRPMPTVQGPGGKI